MDFLWKELGVLGQAPFLLHPLGHELQNQWTQRRPSQAMSHPCGCFHAAPHEIVTDTQLRGVWQMHVTILLWVWKCLEIRSLIL